jgi:hypothetical protein
MCSLCTCGREFHCDIKFCSAAWIGWRLARPRNLATAADLSWLVSTSSVGVNEIRT